LLEAEKAFVVATNQSGNKRKEILGLEASLATLKELLAEKLVAVKELKVNIED
jgi:hypothetical protein